MKREYKEETGASPDSIFTMTALGLTYEHKDLNHPVLNVFVRSELTSVKMLDIAPKGSDGEVQLLSTRSPIETMQLEQEEGADIEPDGQWSFALAQAYWGFHIGRMLVDDLGSDQLKINVTMANVILQSSGTRSQRL